MVLFRLNRNSFLFGIIYRLTGRLFYVTGSEWNGNLFRNSFLSGVPRNHCYCVRYVPVYLILDFFVEKWIEGGNYKHKHVEYGGFLHDKIFKWKDI